MIAGSPVRRAGKVRRLLLSALLLTAVLLPGTGSAAERGVLVVEGSGNTTTEWMLTGEAGIDVPPNLPVELTGGGPYVGALFEPLEPQRSPVGAVQVRAFDDGTGGAVARLGSQLAPGRYRVTLFGQGPVRVRFSMSDRQAAGVRIVPRRPLPVTFLGQSQALGAGYDTARIDFPGALAAGRRALQLDLGDGNQVGLSQRCATRGAECEEPLLPLCLPAPTPCSPATTQGARPGAMAGEPRAAVRLVPAQPVARRLLWSFEGYRDVPGKLRAVAIVF